MSRHVQAWCRGPQCGRAPIWHTHPRCNPPPPPPFAQVHAPTNGQRERHVRRLSVHAQRLQEAHQMGVGGQVVDLQGRGCSAEGECGAMRCASRDCNLDCRPGPNCSGRRVTAPRSVSPGSPGPPPRARSCRSVCGHHIAPRLRTGSRWPRSCGANAFTWTSFTRVPPHGHCYGRAWGPEPHPRPDVGKRRSSPGRQCCRSQTTHLCSNHALDSPVMPDPTTATRCAIPHC